MTEQKIYKLKIDKNFKRLIPPLTAKELNQLEANIIRNGCYEPLSVWNNTILDGHNRYEICKRLNIPFSIQKVSLKSREEAIIWICATQLVRRNISNVARRYLIGKRYEMEKIIGAHYGKELIQQTPKEDRSKNATEPLFEDTIIRTRIKIGEEYGISEWTVYQYGVYSHALDSLSHIVPNLVSKVFSGEVILTQENVIEMSKLSEKTIRGLNKQLTKDEDKFNGDLRKIAVQRVISKTTLPLRGGSIKDMPSYDPDAEISALALTVPSWVSSINRTYSATDFRRITGEARHRLEKELIGLKETIEIMLMDIKGEV